MSGWGLAYEERGEERESEEVERKSKWRRVKESLELAFGVRGTDKRGEGAAEENMGNGAFALASFGILDAESGGEGGDSSPLTPKSVGPTFKSGSHQFHHKTSSFPPSTSTTNDVVLNYNGSFPSHIRNTRRTQLSFSFFCLCAEKIRRKHQSTILNPTTFID